MVPSVNGDRADHAPQARLGGLLRSADSAFLSLGVGTFQGARLLVNLVAAGVLGPSGFGEWVVLTLILQYASVVTLGIPNGAGREVPVRLGAGRSDSAALVEDVSLGGTLIAALLGAILATGATLVLAGPDDPDRYAIASLMGLAVATQQLYLLSQVLFRSRFAFRAVAAQMILTGVVVLVSGLGLLRFGIVGLSASVVLANVVALLAAAALLPRRPRVRWDRAEWRRLIDVGLPIMLAGFAFIVLTTADRWLVLAFLGREALGVYGLVGLVVSGLLLIASVAGQQYFPRLAFAFGAGSGGAELASIARSQGRSTAVAIALISVPTVAGAWLAVTFFLPAYTDALLPLTVVAVGIVAYAASSGFGNLLNAVGHHRAYLTLLVLAVVGDLVLVTAMLAIGAGLLGVAIATTLTLTVYAYALRRRAIAIAGSITAEDRRDDDGAHLAAVSA